jgi:hypothetical protein
MLIKIHKAYREIVAVCDKNLLGKTFEEGNKLLDVRESFFKGEEISEAKLIETLREFSSECDATFNIVGKKSIDAALKAGIVDETGVRSVKGIPFALILL